MQRSFVVVQSGERHRRPTRRGVGAIRESPSSPDPVSRPRPPFHDSISSPRPERWGSSGSSPPTRLARSVSATVGCGAAVGRGGVWPARWAIQRIVPTPPAIARRPPRLADDPPSLRPWRSSREILRRGRRRTALATGDGGRMPATKPRTVGEVWDTKIQSRRTSPRRRSPRPTASPRLAPQRARFPGRSRNDPGLDRVPRSALSALDRPVGSLASAWPLGTVRTYYSRVRSLSRGSSQLILVALRDHSGPGRWTCLPGRVGTIDYAHTGARRSLGGVVRVPAGVAGGGSSVPNEAPEERGGGGTGGGSRPEPR